MFLTESFENIENVSADPIYSMELVQEATDEWHNLCMKMIKLEHSAIVSEDAGLLEAGMEEFKTKGKELAKRVYNKFMEYLERVRVEWSKIQAAIATKLVNTNVMSQLKDNVAKLQGQKFSCKASLFNGGLGKKVMQAALSVSADGIDGVTEAVNSVTESITGTKDEEAALTSALVGQALDFLKVRAEGVKAIQKMKNEATKAYKKSISEMEKTERGSERLSLTMFQRACNKLIIAINKVTSEAVKICNAAKRNATGKEKSDAKKAAKGIARGTASASILDDYE